MMTLGLVFGGFFTYEYKPIGLSVNMSDHLLSWAASSAAVIQMVTRICVGYMYDKVGFKIIFISMMVVNSLNGAFCY